MVKANLCSQAGRAARAVLRLHEDLAAVAAVAVDAVVTAREAAVVVVAEAEAGSGSLQALTP